VTYTRGRIDTIDSPDDQHLVARIMSRNGINKYKKNNLRHVGYLQRYPNNYNLVVCFLMNNAPASEFLYADVS